jgi:hypothetical protein
MTLSLTINAYRLLALIKKTRGHMPEDEVLPICGIRFENNGAYLHALATDRYTFAVARTKLRQAAEPWSLTVAAEDVNWLQGWLEAHEGADIIDINVEGNELKLGSERGQLSILASTATFPKWQNMFRDALREATPDRELTAFDTGMLARWKGAGSHLRVWQAAPLKPILLVGEDFLGLQMPARYSGEDKDRAAVLGDWINSLDGGSEPAELPEPPQQVAVPKMIEATLHQTLRSTQEMYGADMDTDKGRAAFNAWVFSGIYAWSAYRLLEALRQADPDLAETTARDLDEQLESGEIGEWAWDAAEKAGFDPQKWHDEYEAHLKKRAAERATSAA